jgi:putative tricarboxylic transport membrane protein
MDAVHLSKRKGYLLIGTGGLLLSAGYLGMAFQLPLGEMARPGAGIFPIVVGVLMAFASLSTVWESWRTEAGEQLEFPLGEDRSRLFVLVGALLVYVVGLPWLGQIAASTLFLISLIRVMSDVSWLRVITYSLGISITIYVVFVRLLNVLMPRGIIDF